jgi:hypothetical protein
MPGRSSACPCRIEGEQVHSAVTAHLGTRCPVITVHEAVSQLHRTIQDMDNH